MYGRRIGGRVLTLGHEGVLYRKSFVMYDRDTDSIWVHTTGTCVKGAMRGSQLEFLPSVVTSWGHWKRRHPATKVLDGDKDPGRAGTFALDRNPSHFGISVGQGDRAVLVRVDDLSAAHVVNERLGSTPIVIFFDPVGRFAKAWVRGERSFRFDHGEKVVVDEKGQAWDLVRGRRVGGEAAKQLKPLPATVWRIDRWRGFYPKAKIHKPNH